MVTTPLRFVALVRPKWRVVVEMEPAGDEYAVRLNGQRMRSLYAGEEDVQQLVRRRYGGLEDWRPEVAT
jgi:hypothetical protein